MLSGKADPNCCSKKCGPVNQVVVFCVYCGEHEGKDNRLRNASTSQNGCPYKDNRRRNDAVREAFTLVVDYPNHNHDPTKDVAAYSAARVLNSEQGQMVEQL